MIYFFYGPDNSRSEIKVSELKKKFLSKNPSGSGLTVVEFEKEKQVGFELLRQAIGEQNLFAEKRLIIGRNFVSNGSLGSSKAALEFLRDKKELVENQETFLVFWEEDSKSGEEKTRKEKIPKAKEGLIRFLLENAQAQEFELLSGPKLEQWIRMEAKRINPEADFSQLALKKLVTYVGEETLKLKNEIKKLVTFREKGAVTAEEVEKLVQAEVDANIFETVEALSANNPKRALALFHEQLEMGSDPFYVLAMYAGQIRNLIKIGDCFWRGIQRPDAIAKEVGLHPFVVQKGLRQIQKTSEKELKTLYQRLGELDEKVKTGRLDIVLGIDLFILGK
jgi:DNA polymerase III delta subunit